jgi:soluble lytic murein transglycosylase-like protein
MARYLGTAAAAALALLASVPRAASAGTYPVTATCVLESAKLQGIPPHIILGLLKTEGGRIGMEHVNRDGSVDLGPMQINARAWLDRLARMHFNGDRGAAYAALRDHGCYNVLIGGWIFRQYLDEAGGNYATAVGYYNSHNPGPMMAYERRFATNFVELFGGMMGAH